MKETVKNGNLEPGYYREGVIRFVLNIPFPEIEGKPMFSIKRSYGRDSTYLCNPPDLIPLRVQDAISTATGFQIAQSLVGLYRYCTDQYEPRDRKSAIDDAFKRFKRTMDDLRDYPNQPHIEVFSGAIKKIDDLSKQDNKVGRIARFSDAYGILTPFAFFKRDRETLRQKGMLGIFPEGDELMSMSEDQKSIIAVCGSYTAWEALREARVPYFMRENPFAPVLDLIKQGHVGFAIERDDGGRERYLTHSYSGEPVTEIDTLLAA